MIWIRPLSADVTEAPDVIGGKAHGLVVLRRLGLPVPPGFVVSTAACRAFLRDGRLPDGLAAELTAAVADLEAVTARRFGGRERPLVVSVRSGAAVTMPGMMSTVLNLGLTTAATAALAAETGDRSFAHDSRSRFLSSFAAALGRRDGGPVPDDAARQLELAVATVFSSWNTARARTYRDIHDIAHDLGTAVTVQAMVFGNRDDHSGTGVAFSRDPNTGAPAPFGEVLFGRQGEDVVSGRSPTRPLHDLAAREPVVWADLRRALHRIEEHYRDACHVEFTFEAGRLWLLQVRPGHLVGAAAVRVAVDLADRDVITRPEALLRVCPQDLHDAGTPRVVVTDDAALLARGLGACPGVATGRIATTAEAAVAMAADGPVILVRPETSPLDMHGLAAAAGIVTARGGPASHAAIVARALGKPAVVGAADLTVDVAQAAVRTPERTVGQGTLVTIDGTGGEVVIGTARVVTADADPRLGRLLGWADSVSGSSESPGAGAARLAAAHAVLRAGAA